MHQRLTSLKYLPILLLGLALSAADAQLRPRGFETDIFLYQPDDVLQERLSGSVRGISDYAKRLMSTCEASFASAAPMPETLNIIVAVRPGKRSRVWFVSSRSTDTPQRQALRRKLEAITPCEVRGGPVVFALSYKVAGGDGKRLKNPPIPKEWEDAAKGKELLITWDGILDIVWPAHK
jgi:hypothetical protein